MLRLVLLTWVMAAGCNQALGLDDARGGNDEDRFATDAANPADARAASPVGCPDSFAPMVPASTTLYRFVAEAATWPDATAACAALAQPGGSFTHLVVLSDDSERAELAAMFDGRVAWIGYSDRVDVDSVFRWVTQEPSTVGDLGSPAWESGEPNLDGAGCVELSADARLADTSCTEERVYACECDAHPDQPANR